MGDFSYKKDISIVLCGEAGQGIQTVEDALAQILKHSGYNIFATKEYMSRIRGGANSTEIRISSEKASCFVDKIDILIPISKGAVEHIEKRISGDTLILGEKEFIAGYENKIESNFIEVPWSKIAIEIGGAIYSNMVAVGVISGLLGVENSIIESYIKEKFTKKGEDIIKKNVEAVSKGYSIGKSLVETGRIKIDIKKTGRQDKEILLSGSDAVAIGAIAGGCNFLSFYPMSPSTGVATFLANNAKNFDIIVEQAEDEISAINMSIGAWYAGARGLVTTSGGGFALMVEGLSLSAMLETPVVIHIGQRPGPATGLPTRTEQADLLFSLFAGHGEFPRVIYAPGSVEDAFYLTQKAFNVADKYQVPVIILTDQYFLDTYYNIPILDISFLKVEKNIIETDKDYKRFRLDKPISPRGIPGFGEGLVSVDSDEHDEDGHITEDLELRVKMVDKKQGKFKLLEKDIIPPELIGSENYKTLVISWGSTKNVIEEAIEELGIDSISLLHFNQVYPLHPAAAKYIKDAQKTIIIENNATSQFGKVIKLETGIDIHKSILKYNGLPFSKEELKKKLMEAIDYE